METEELKFKCPAFLAQRFWLLCAERDQTPGAVLREFMMDQIALADPEFEIDLKQVTGKDAWSVQKG